MRYFSVFSGIGAMDYGLEMAGWQCVGQCEIDAFCSRALAKHWPALWRWNDVKTLTGREVAEQCGAIDALVGGPPCQPASIAGERRGSADDRWLWPDFLRLVREAAPVYVLAENPPDVLSLDVDGVRFSEWLALQFHALGYAIFPILLSAEGVGAPHERERIWFVAYSDRLRQPQSEGRFGEQRGWIKHGSEELEHSDSGRRGREQEGQREGQAERGRLIVPGEELDNAAVGVAYCAGLAQHSREHGDARSQFQATVRASWPMGQGYGQYEWEQPRDISIAELESALGASVDGNARRVARWRRAAVKATGNGVVPQCVAVIGRAILAADAKMPIPAPRLPVAASEPAEGIRTECRESATAGDCGAKNPANWS